MIFRDATVEPKSIDHSLYCTKVDLTGVEIEGATNPISPFDGTIHICNVDETNMGEYFNEEGADLEEGDDLNEDDNLVVEGAIPQERFRIVVPEVNILSSKEKDVPVVVDKTFFVDDLVKSGYHEFASEDQNFEDVEAQVNTELEALSKKSVAKSIAFENSIVVGGDGTVYAPEIGNTTHVNRDNRPGAPDTSGAKDDDRIIVGPNKYKKLDNIKYDQYFDFDTFTGISGTFTMPQPYDIVNTVDTSRVINTNSSFPTPLDPGKYFVVNGGSILMQTTGSGVISSSSSGFNSRFALNIVPFDKEAWNAQQKTLGIKRKILNNLRPKHIPSRLDIDMEIPDNEKTAIETLREEISESEYRKYLKFGFILVEGRSGDTYQIFKNKSHTKVWRNGKVIEEICVRIKQDVHVPPTDKVIALKVIIETSEQEFKKLGNVYKMVA